MRQGGERIAGSREGLFREGRDAKGRGLSEVEDHPAPGIDHEAVAVGATAAAVVAALGGGDEPALLFDGASAQKGMPVGSPCAFREGRGDGKHGSALAALALEKQGKAQVIANGEAHGEALAFREAPLFARARVLAFVETRAVGEVHGEQVKLAIGGLKAAVAIEVQGRVVGARRV